MSSMKKMIGARNGSTYQLYSYKRGLAEQLNNVELPTDGFG